MLVPLDVSLPYMDILPPVTFEGTSRSVIRLGDRAACLREYIADLTTYGVTGTLSRPHTRRDSTPNDSSTARQSLSEDLPD